MPPQTREGQFDRTAGRTNDSEAAGGLDRALQRLRETREETPTPLFDKIFGNKEERNEKREQREADRRERRAADGKDARGKKGEAVAITNEGGVKELKLPGDFVKGKVNQDELNEGETRLEFQSKSHKQTKVAYSKNDWYPDADSQKDLKDLLDPSKTKPRNLTEEEWDKVGGAIPNPAYGSFSFTVTNMAIKNVDGRNVLVMEASANDSDKRYYGYFFNPKDPDTKTDAPGSIESLWFEAPNKAFKATGKDVLPALDKAKFQ